MKSFLVLILLIYYVNSQILTEKQVKAASKLVKNVCQPKNKVTNDQINAMHKGIFDDNREMMCYMECCLRVGKITKNGKFDYENSIKLSQTLPESRRQVTIDTTTACKDAGTSNDKCVYAQQVYKCIYFENPDNFFLP